MNTIKQAIVSYLEGLNGLSEWGGTLAREIAYRTKHKESVVERRCRELAEEGRIKVTRERVNGKGPLCVKYSVPRRQPVMSEVRFDELQAKLF